MVLKVVSVADAVAAGLRARMLTGELPGGAELRDTDLAQEYGVARPTVRAAVQVLVADGLLERGRGRSARVRSLSAADAQDLYLARRPLELEAVRIVLESRPSLEPVAAALAELESLAADAPWNRVAEADLGFHRAVVAAAGSSRLLRLFDSLGTELRLLVAQLRPAYQAANGLIAEHRELLDLLHGGTLEQTGKAWQEHLEHALMLFIAAPIGPGPAGSTR